MPKYGNKPTEYNGQRYDSRLEANYAAGLDFRLRGKDIAGWERQVPLKLVVNGVRITTYRMDFKVIHKDGTVEMVECKGYETAVWKLKRKLFEALFAEDLKAGRMKYTIVR